MKKLRVSVASLAASGSQSVYVGGAVKEEDLLLLRDIGGK